MLLIDACSFQSSSIKQLSILSFTMSFTPYFLLVYNQKSPILLFKTHVIFEQTLNINICKCFYTTLCVALPPVLKLSALSITPPFLAILTVALRLSWLPVREGHEGCAGKMRGWQLHLFIMWGTIAHLERQPELVFSLILAPTQRARINRQGRFIYGLDLFHGLWIWLAYNTVCMWCESNCKDL